MDVITQLVTLVSLVVNILMIVAILRIFHISATLDKLLKAVKESDKNRRDEFNSLSDQQ